jgi:hypothetical protein
MPIWYLWSRLYCMYIPFEGLFHCVYNGLLYLQVVATDSMLSHKPQIKSNSCQESDFHQSRPLAARSRRAPQSRVKSLQPAAHWSHQSQQPAQTHGDCKLTACTSSRGLAVACAGGRRNHAQPCTKLYSASTETPASTPANECTTVNVL